MGAGGSGWSEAEEGKVKEATALQESENSSKSSHSKHAKC